MQMQVQDKCSSSPLPNSLPDYAPTHIKVLEPPERGQECIPQRGDPQNTVGQGTGHQQGACTSAGGVCSSFGWGTIIANSALSQEFLVLLFLGT